MKNLALLMTATALYSTAAAAEKNLTPWDRQPIGVRPVGASAPNTARTDTTDYGVKFRDGSPALGCNRTMMQLTTPDGKSGETAVFSCKW